MSHDQTYKDPLFWLALLLGAAVLSLTLWYGIGVDSATIGYCSWVWKNYGLPPYVGCIEGDYPGMFLIHRLQLAVSGESVLGFRIFDIIVQLSCLAMIYSLAKSYSQKSLAGFLAVVFYSIYYYGLDYYFEGEREAYILWLIFLCLILARVLKNRVFLRAFATGLLLGFAFMVKPTFALLWPVFAAWFFWEETKGSPWRRLSEMAVLAASWLLPGLIIVMLYWRWGYLKQLFEITIWFDLKSYAGRPLLYSVFPFNQVRELTTGALLIIQLKSVLLSHKPLLAGGLLALFLAYFAWREKEQRKNMAIIWALILVSLISMYIQRGIWDYHKIPFWGLMIILAAWGYGWVLDEFRAAKKSVWRGIAAYGIFPAALFSLMVVELPDYLRNAAFQNFHRSFQQAYALEYQDAALASDYLRSKLGKGEEYYYFGAISNLPYLAGRKLVTAFPFSEPFFWTMKDGSPNLVREKWLGEYTGALLKFKPRFFVFNTAMPVTVFNPLPADFVAVARKEMPDLFRTVDQYYQVVERFGEIEIYELKDAAAKPE